MEIVKKQKLNSLMPHFFNSQIPLPEKGRFFHVWCRQFKQDVDEISQHLV